MICLLTGYIVKVFFLLWFRKTRSKLSFHIKSVTILRVTATVMLGICLGITCFYLLFFLHQRILKS